MNIDQLIPPVLQPYKAWIVLALMIVVYIIRPSLPAPQANSSWGYVFVFNVFDKIAGNFGNAAHTPENIPASAAPDPQPAPVALIVQAPGATATAAPTK